MQLQIEGLSRMYLLSPIPPLPTLVHPVYPQTCLIGLVAGLASEVCIAMSLKAKNI